jgi:hypothetical protein
MTKRGALFAMIRLAMTIFVTVDALSAQLAGA